MSRLLDNYQLDLSQQVNYLRRLSIKKSTLPAFVTYTISENNVGEVQKKLTHVRPNDDYHKESHVQELPFNGQFTEDFKCVMF